jgi:hypothetical protein
LRQWRRGVGRAAGVAHGAGGVAAHAQEAAHDLYAVLQVQAVLGRAHYATARRHHIARQVEALDAAT